MGVGAPGSLASTAKITALWRYPVKSMSGEAIRESEVSASGLLGDRRYAVLDLETGTVASAKQPRRWRALLQCRARYLTEPVDDRTPAPALITLPNGSSVRMDAADIDARLSAALGRPVRLIASAPEGIRRDADRSALERLRSGDVVQREPLAMLAPAGTFFDLAPIHLLSSTSLARFNPPGASGPFDPRRFRPNLVIASDAPVEELSWLGRTVACGPMVRLLIVDPCPRCVMTTLVQGDLPNDPNVLRTAHGTPPVASLTAAPGKVFPAIVGVYGGVVETGFLRVGDQAGATD